MMNSPLYSSQMEINFNCLAGNSQAETKSRQCWSTATTTRRVRFSSFINENLIKVGCLLRLPRSRVGSRTIPIRECRGTSKQSAGNSQAETMSRQCWSTATTTRRVRFSSFVNENLIKGGGWVLHLHNV